MNQATVGAWGVARQDLELVGGGGSVTLEAQDTMTTYLWEVISAPEGSTATVSSPTTQTATLDLDVTGGYLVRLTVDDGLPTKDLLVLYAGVPLTNSGLPIPAFNETVFDNTDLATDGYVGYERKLTAFMKWADGVGTPVHGRTVFPSSPSTLLTVSFTALPSTDYTVNVVIEYTGGGSPDIVPFVVHTKTTSSFTIETTGAITFNFPRPTVIKAMNAERSTALRGFFDGP